MKVVVDGVATSGNNPTGAASGDLAGTYPGPTVDNITLSVNAQGDVYYRGATGLARLPAGTAGYVLTTQGANQNPTWSSVSSGPSGPAGGDLGGTYPNPTVTDLTITSEARGDLLYRGASAWGRLAVGASGRVLYSDGTDPAWATVSTILDGISSTRGVVLYRGASGWAALAPSTAGYVLTDGGAGADPSWAAASGGGEFPATIENGGGVVGALTTTLGYEGYGAIRVSGTVRDASGAVIQCRGVLRFSASGAGGAFYNITDYAGARRTTAPGHAAGVAGVMAGEFDFLTDASGFFDFKINWTGAGPLVCVWAQCGAGVASTSGTIR